MKKVIVAPLHWGLGHATRCVPLIKQLQKQHLIPVIASDGVALAYLQKEFPKLEVIQLPSYQISYAKNLRWKLFCKIPVICLAVLKEHLLIKRYITKHRDVVGIISDNRFGCFSKDIPSVYITHQLRVLSGITTFITTFIHQQIAKQYNDIWVPDTLENPLSGILSDSNSISSKKIGVLSRFNNIKQEQIYDYLLLLSGPEPNRTQLEKRLIHVFASSEKKILLVQGIIQEKQTRKVVHGIEIVNYLLEKELQEKIVQSKIVVCRSGYSSIMDLSILQKKVILIPTKHQPEQEYLATYLEATYGISVVDESQLSKRMLELNPCELPVSKMSLPEDLLRLF